MRNMLAIYTVLLAMTFGSLAHATGPDQDEVQVVPAASVEQVLAEPAPAKIVETTNAESQPVTVVQAPASQVSVVSQEPSDTSNADWIKSAITLLGNTKGATTWVWVLIAAQLVLGFMKTKWAQSISWLTGNVQFLTSMFFTLIIGPVTAITQGMQPSAAFGTGVVITGLVKLGFEIYERLVKKDATKTA